MLTFRALLALNTNATDGWSTTLSPRARANPQLNHWLTQHLPAPAAVQWTVRNGNAAPTLQSFAGLDLEPIDIVPTSGQKLGDQSSELERTLIRHYRCANAVPDDRATVIAPVTPPDPATTTLFDFRTASAGNVSLAALQPLLARLRRLITQGRTAHAADWRRAADRPQNDDADPTGSASGDPKLDNLARPTDRIDAAANDLTVAGKALKDALAALAPLRAAFDPGTAADAGWPPALDSVRAALFGLAAFGMPEAVPVDGLTVSPSLIDSLLRQADAIVAAVDARLARAAELRATAFTDPLPSGEPDRTNEIALAARQPLRQNDMDAAKSLLGPNFCIVPLFKSDPAQASELQQALAAPVVGDAMTVEAAALGRSRPPAARGLTWAMAGARWIHGAIGDPVVAQLPYQAGAPWIGGTFTSDLPLGEWLSLLIVGAATAGGLQAGLVIDDWTETAPTDQ